MTMSPASLARPLLCALLMLAGSAPRVRAEADVPPTFRGVVEQKAHASAGEDADADERKLAASLLLEHVEHFYAHYPVPPGGLTLPERLGTGAEGFVAAVLEAAGHEAAARGDARVPARDVEAAIARLLPQATDDAGNVTFFPDLPDEQIRVSALDFESLHSFGLSWRLLQVMLDAKLLRLEPEPDASAAEALSEGLARYALLLLRVGGDLAREGQLAPFVRGSDLTRADYQIRRLTHSAAQAEEDSATEPEQASATEGEQGSADARAAPSGGAPATEPRAETIAPVYQPASAELRAALDRRYYDAWGLTPDDAALHTAYANQAAGVLSYGEAIEHFEKALELDPERIEAHIGYGLLLMRVGRDAAAIPHFEKVIGTGRPFEPMAHAHLGKILGTLGRRDEALVHFQAAARLNPDNAQSRFNLGLAYYQQERFEEAVVELRKAVELDPSLAIAHLRLGGALGKLGRHREALATYQTLLGLNYRDPVALYEIGVTFQVLEDQQHARRAFERALAQAKRSRMYRDLQKQIEERLAEL